MSDSPEQRALYVAKQRYEQATKAEELSWNQVRFGNSDDRLHHRRMLKELELAKMHYLSLRNMYEEKLQHAEPEPAQGS